MASLNVIYLRTSTTEQNPENQLRECQSINTYGDFEVIQDQQSAWNDRKERPGFESLHRKIIAGQVSQLIVWDLDRLYRNRKRLVEFFELCKIKGCQVHSFRQQWLEELNSIPAPFNDIMHHLMLQIMAWIAEEESNRKSARVRAAVRQKDGLTLSYKGNHWGRKQLSTQKKNLIAKLKADGMTIRQISAELGVSVGAVHKYLSSEVGGKREQ